MGTCGARSLFFFFFHVPPSTVVALTASHLLLSFKTSDSVLVDPCLYFYLYILLTMFIWKLFPELLEFLLSMLRLLLVDKSLTVLELVVLFLRSFLDRYYNRILLES